MNEKQADEIIKLLKGIKSELNNVALYTGNTNEYVERVLPQLEEVLASKE